MALNALQQSDLSVAVQFRARMKVLLCEKAKAVAVAAIGGAITQASKDLAARVQTDADRMTANICNSFVSDNAIKSNTTTGSGATLDTDRTDAQLTSAIGVAWDAGSWNNVV